MVLLKVAILTLVFSCREQVQLIMTSMFLCNWKLFKLQKVLSSTKPILLFKEWRTTKHCGQSLDFAVIALTLSLRTARYMVFLRAGFTGYWKRLQNPEY